MMNVKGITVKDLVKGTTVEFVFYSKGNLWYKITNKDFEFPVPVSDVGDGVFKNTDKAMLFMRYIRKQLSYLQEAQKS